LPIEGIQWAKRRHPVGRRMFLRPFVGGTYVSFAALSRQKKESQLCLLCGSVVGYMQKRTSWDLLLDGGHRVRKFIIDDL
jgi:hypothetical protein